GGSCSMFDCSVSVFNTIKAYSPPAYLRGGNYNMCRFMIYKYATGGGSSANGLYQFDGINAKSTNNDIYSHAFPTVERNVTTPSDPSFELSIPASYNNFGQVQHSILNDSAKYREVSGTSNALDTEYDPPTIVSLKEVSTATSDLGHSMYLAEVVDTSSNPSIESYAPYLLIRYPLYKGDTFNQGLESYETNRSFSFCSIDNQMQVAYDRTSKAIGSRSLEIWLETKLTTTDLNWDLLIDTISVAIDGNLAIVGVRYDDDNGYNSGSAYIFRFDGSTWQEEAKLTADDGASEDLFGCSVAISGDVALIGSRYDDDNGYNSGSAYIYRFNGIDTWQQEAKLLASDGASSDYFGVSVAIDGNLAIIGAYGDDDNGWDSGSAYI
ncbi:MAG: FG-GAP repeat protein, partial [Anaerolineales bacterium]|nr:FG-GAP repeat protein [Anaerolineales bacterium]